MVEGKQPPGDKVVVIDNEGYFMGVSLAERLAVEGKKVTLITHLGEMAPYMHYTLEAPNENRRLRKLGVTVVTLHVPTRIEPGVVRTVHVYDEAEHEFTWEADGVVLVTQRNSNETLYRQLKEEIGMAVLRAEGITGVYRIGDCVAPRLIADCVFDGHRLAREIDSTNPEVALPFIRERRLMHATEEDFRLDSRAIQPLRCG